MSGWGPMSTFLDLDTWPRRAAFEHFLAFDNPYFSLCTHVDVAPTRTALAERGGRGFALACHFLALRLANDIEPFRYRLESGRVRVHDAVHGSTTVLREDESFGFAYLEHCNDFASFATHGAAAIQAAKQGLAGFDPRPDDTALIHFTTLPWVHFSSFSHARNWGSEDSIPKLAFGRIEVDGTRQWMPLSIEVHHALMDGVHVGRFVERFKAALRNPADWLAGAHD